MNLTSHPFAPITQPFIFNFYRDVAENSAVIKAGRGARRGAWCLMPDARCAIHTPLNPCLTSYMTIMTIMTINVMWHP